MTQCQQCVGDYYVVCYVCAHKFALRIWQRHYLWFMAGMNWPYFYVGYTGLDCGLDRVG